MILKEYDNTLEEIGAFFKKDHTSIIHSRNMFSEHYEKEISYKKSFDKFWDYYEKQVYPEIIAYETFTPIISLKKTINELKRVEIKIANLRKRKFELLNQINEEQLNNVLISNKDSKVIIKIVNS